jgi:hypothetical protein
MFVGQTIVVCRLPRRPLKSDGLRHKAERENAPAHVLKKLKEAFKHA